MTLSDEEVRELGRLLAARRGEGRRERPKLRLVVPPTPKLLDHLARDAHLRRVAQLRKAFRLDWLVEQATFNVASVSCLEDCDLIRLLDDMERARECIADGVSFDDAELWRDARNAEARRRKAMFEDDAERCSIANEHAAASARAQQPQGDEAPF